MAAKKKQLLLWHYSLIYTEQFSSIEFLRMFKNNEDIQLIHPVRTGSEWILRTIDFILSSTN